MQFLKMLPKYRAPLFSFNNCRCCESACFLYVALLMAASAASAEPCRQSDLGASEVVDRLIARNVVTAATLAGHTSTRHYHLEFHGVDSLVADVVVRASYRAPDHKDFRIQSESGSGLLQKRVLKQVMKSELEASQLSNRAEIALTPQNYAFRLLGCEQVDGRGSYVLEAMPRHVHKFLIKGRIYVDDQDFAVIRVRAEPAKNPSWWTVRNEIEQTYIKVGEFWLPDRITTNTTVRFLGRAFLTIDYGEYRLMGLNRENRYPGCKAGPRVGLLCGCEKNICGGAQDRRSDV